MSEYIGSRISLISKSDIKYVGTLKSIDSETATVSLQDVQCHGTEGRKGNPAEEIPGSDTVYDGIVFRGSDVKDLTILAPPKENRPPQMPNDPAILGSSEIRQQQPQPPPQQQQQQQQTPQQVPRGPPPSFQQQQQFGFQGPPSNFAQAPPRFQGPGGAHGFPGQPGAVPGYGMFGAPPPGYSVAPMAYGPTGPLPGQGFPPPPGHFAPPQQQPIGPPGFHPQRPPQQLPNQPQAPIGSQQNTPQPASNSQVPPPPTTQPQQPRAAEMSTTPAPTSGPPPPVESKPAAAPAPAPSATTPAPSQAPAAPKPAQKTGNRVAVPLASPAPNKQQPKKAPVPAIPQATAPVAQAAPAPSTATEAATAAVAAAMAKLGTVNNQARPVDNLAQKVNQMRLQDGQNRGRGRGRGGPRGGRRESQHKTMEVPQEDFDFETSNAKFNKQDLAKEAIASGSPLGSPINGNKPDPIATASNGHAETEEVVIPPKPVEKGYDKKSSFFDNISSDLKDRTEQQQSGGYVDGRAMRRDERTKNIDTFGQGSIDGGYRGRGRGRGRGFGRGGRGFRGGYRGRGGAEATAV